MDIDLYAPPHCGHRQVDANAPPCRQPDVRVLRRYGNAPGEESIHDDQFADLDSLLDKLAALYRDRVAAVGA